MHALDKLTAQDISKRLQPVNSPFNAQRSFDVPSDLIGDQFRDAAVLVPFVRLRDEWHLLYIRRACSERDRHSGQVAFAGGKRDPQDVDLYRTALREAHEEIGIDPQDVAILGHLPPHHSISHFKITPIVGQVPWPYSLQLQPSEVDRAFTIPLTWLAEPRNHELRLRELNGTKVPVVYFKEYDGELLWGATARMTLNLLYRLGVDFKELEPPMARAA
ncbi:NUDIX hydrolase [Thiothrix eikelboomii]|uniref:8-oxo-dGTP pyrophosphatase MutT, NUDIX family n=1 Tax=Thiothrix eikelboomii TaxID=92487 RepID=A0A1T4WAH1_9GAMM|nr:CoA pyrophosphatase [Thiothrix eikelboomii]SKA74282.1 8-oxo-dGTP pyrophosphatase MutT, NUDIX family [Thiothrix eikelboomii]